MAGHVTQSVHFWHQHGDTQKDKAEREPGFPSPHFTGGETEVRPGGMTGPRCQSWNQLISELTGQSYIYMNSANLKCQRDNVSVEKSFLAHFFNNKNDWFQSIFIIPASSGSARGQFKTTVNPNAIYICSETPCRARAICPISIKIILSFFPLSLPDCGAGREWLRRRSGVA